MENFIEKLVYSFIVVVITVVSYCLILDNDDKGDLE